MRLLVFGRGGQLGWELERALAPLGDVRALARADVDVTDSEAVAAAIRTARPDVVVNAAAYTAVDAAETDERRAYAVNAIAPGVMAETLRATGGMLVHYSTDYVFDGEKDDAYDEADTPNPLGAYGRTKLAGERAIRDVESPHVILRTSWVYGLRGRNFLLTMVRLGAERAVLPVVSDQTGAPTWCRLVAEATAQLLVARRDVLGDVRSTYHVACAGSCTWRDFAAAIVRRWYGARAPRIEAVTTEAFGAAARRPRNSRLSCARLAAETGIRLPDWEHALELVHAEAAS
jgi:dTDP-4-dehydrorhamnose reductase